MKILFFLFITLSTVSAFGQESTQASANANLYLNGILVSNVNDTLSRTSKNLITVDGTYYDSFRISCSGCLIQEKGTYYLVTPSTAGSTATITVSGVKGQKQWNLFSVTMKIE